MDMKANELKIGNYLWYEQTVHIVESISRTSIGSWWVNNGKPVIENGLYDDYIKRYSPIELNGRWLLKLGFVERSINERGGTRHLFISPDNIIINNENNSFYFESRNIITTVHQLQNLYFALTGKELKIVKANKFKNMAKNIEEVKPINIPGYKTRG